MTYAEHAQCLLRRGMDEAAGHHRYRRQTTHPTLGDIGPVLFSPPLTGCREGRDVGHRGTGRRDASPTPREDEEILQPADGNLLELCAKGRAHPQPGVVIEG